MASSLLLVLLNAALTLHTAAQTHPRDNPTGCYNTGCSQGGCPAGYGETYSTYCFWQGVYDETCCPTVTCPAPVKPGWDFTNCKNFYNFEKDTCKPVCASGWVGPPSGLVANCQLDGTWAFSGTCTPANWFCVTSNDGLVYPVQWNGAEIECLSLDATNCQRTSTLAACQNVIATTYSPSIRPLVCGAAHTAKWGGPGYEIPTHWCRQGWEQILPGSKPPGSVLPSSWVCVGNTDGVMYPVRWNGADIEALSLDARNSLGSYSTAGCQNIIATTSSASIRPLVCGAAHTAVWGGPGYDSPTHWCRQGWDRIIGPGGWVCVGNTDGRMLPVRWNGVEIEAVALDAKNPLSAASLAGCQNLIATTSPASIRPLVCGARSMIVWGTTGYDVPNHWCRQGWERLVGPRPIPSPSPSPSPSLSPSRSPVSATRSPSPSPEFPKLQRVDIVAGANLATVTWSFIGGRKLQTGLAGGALVGSIYVPTAGCISSVAVRMDSSTSYAIRFMTSWGPVIEFSGSTTSGTWTTWVAPAGRCIVGLTSGAAASPAITGVLTGRP